MSRRALLLSAPILVAAIRTVAACTGSDPELTASEDAGSDTFVPPGDAAGGDGGVDAADGAQPPPLLSCALELKDPIVAYDVPDGEIEPKFYLLPTGVENIVRIVIAKLPTDSYEVRTQRVGLNTDNALRGTVTIPMTGTKLLAAMPTSFPAGHALLGNGMIDGGFELAAFAIPHASGDPLSSPPAPIPLRAFPSYSDIAGAGIELIGGTYFYAITEKLSDTNWPFECGRNNPEAGPTTFATFTERPPVDGLTLIKGNGKVFALMGEFGPGKQVNAHHIPDSCDLGGGSAAKTLLAFANNTDGPVLIGGTVSPVDPTKSLLFFGEAHLQAPVSFTFWGGRVTGNDFPANGTLQIAPPTFAKGPTLTAAEIPFGNRGTAAVVDDGLALIGSSDIADIDGGMPGLNFVWFDADGNVRAKQVGPNALLADRLPRMGHVGLAVAFNLAGAGATFFLAWIENTSTDGGKHDVLYLNRLKCQ